MRIRIHFRSAARTFLTICALSLLAIGCSADHDDEDDKPRAALAQHTENAGVTLTTEEIEKGGIKTQPAEAATYVPQARGFAVVLPHDAIAQSVSDVITAAAARQQSKAALARVEGLAATPGAFSAETLESARRQAQADEAAYALARRKLSASWGEASPWGEDEHSDTLAKVAAGRLQLIRATFPFGSLNRSVPSRLTFASLSSQESAHAETSTSVWNAPADASIPGHSVFALLAGNKFSEGERLDAEAPAGDPLQGVAVPASAVVVYDGASWAYVEDQPGHFERRAIDSQRSTSAGYFAESGIEAGAQIVVAGSALVLAREINPDTEAD